MNWELVRNISTLLLSVAVIINMITRDYETVQALVLIIILSEVHDIRKQEE